jgi:hypothetical protein
MLSRGIDFPNATEKYFVSSDRILLSPGKKARIEYYQQFRDLRIGCIKKLREILFERTDMCNDVIGMVLEYLFFL